MKSKLIFLDMDGVMNNERSFRARTDFSDLAVVDPACVANLNDLLTRSGAELVLSSTWRIDRIFGPEKTREKLLEKGLLESKQFIGVTEESSFWKNKKFEIVGSRLFGEFQRKFSLRFNERTLEISEFLEGFKLGGNEVESFVIIDDMENFHPLERHHVHTSMDEGLTKADVEKALKILNNEFEETKHE